MASPWSSPCALYKRSGAASLARSRQACAASAVAASAVAAATLAKHTDVNSQLTRRSHPAAFSGERTARVPMAAATSADWSAKTMLIQASDTVPNRNGASASDDALLAADAVSLFSVSAVVIACRRSFPLCLPLGWSFFFFFTYIFFLKCPAPWERGAPLGQVARSDCAAGPFRRVRASVTTGRSPIRGPVALLIFSIFLSLVFFGSRRRCVAAAVGRVAPMRCRCAAPPAGPLQARAAPTGQDERGRENQSVDLIRFSFFCNVCFFFAKDGRAVVFVGTASLLRATRRSAPTARPPLSVSASIFPPAAQARPVQPMPGTDRRQTGHAWQLGVEKKGSECWRDPAS